MFLYYCFNNNNREIIVPCYNLLQLKKKKVSLTAIIKVLCKYYLIHLKARKGKRQISRSSSSDNSDSGLKVHGYQLCYLLLLLKKIILQGMSRIKVIIVICHTCC